MSIVIVESEPSSNVIVEEDSTVVQVPSDEVTVVSVAEQGPAGAATPDVRTADFSKRGVFLGPYTSDLRKYLSGACTLVDLVVAVGTAPTGGTVVVDFLKNGVSIYPGGVGRPVIGVGQHVAEGATGAVFADGDYVQVVIVSGTAADLTVSATFSFL